MYPFNRRKILCEEAGSFFIMALLMILFLPNLLQAKSNILKESLATIQAKALKEMSIIRVHSVYFTKRENMVFP